MDTAEAALHLVAAVEAAPDPAPRADRRGLDSPRAAASAYNGRGPWWNAGAVTLNAAVPAQWLRAQGLVSLLTEHRRLACSS